MDRLGSTLAIAALLFGADASGVLRPPALAPLANITSGEAPLYGQGSSQAPDREQPAPANASAKSDHSKKPQSAGQLKDNSRLTLIRYVDGEMVRVVQSIPSGKKGIHLRAGAALD